MITSDIIKEYFDYSQDGYLVWKKRTSNRINVGDRSGVVNTLGYRVIRLKTKLYLEHILIWCYHNNEYPDCQIDHINRIRTDNRIENLRLAHNNQRDQLQNTNMFKHNTSGFKGVSWCKARNNWECYITVNGKRKNLGRFVDINDAIITRKKAENIYWKFKND